MRLLLVLVMVLISQNAAPPLREQKFEGDIKEKAEKLVVEDLNGQEVKIKELLKDKVVFINFWATWCPYCVDEMPSLERLRTQFTGNKEVVFIFASDESAYTLRNFIKRKRLSVNIPIYVLKSRERLSVYPVIPETYIIAPRSNKIVECIGSAQWDHESVVKLLEKLTKENKPQNQP